MQVQKARHGYKLVKSLYGKYEEIPDAWEYRKLSDLSEKEKDIVAGPFGSNLVVSDYRTEGVPIIRLQNIGRNTFINKNIQFISKEKAEELKYHSYKPDDLVLAKLGDPIGKTCRIPKNFPAGIVVADVVRIRTSETKSDSSFIEYALNSEICERQLNKERIGTTRPRVNLEQIRNLEFPTPPKQEQQKIASILSNVDSLINQTQKEIDQTQRLKKGLMNQLLTRGIGHTKFKKVKWLFGKEIEIPEEWKIKQLGEITSKILDMNHSMPKKISKGIPFITTGYLSQNPNLSLNIDPHNPEIQYISKHDYDIESKKFNAEKGDILFSRYGTLGISKFIDSNQEFLASYSIALIKPMKEVVNNVFLTIFLNSYFVKQQIEFLREQSSNNNLHLSKINNIKILLPKQEEQVLLNCKLTNMDSKISRLESKKSYLEKLKKGLMQKLLTGQIRVKT